MNTVDYSWHVLAIIKVSCLRIENLDKRKKKRIKYNPVITLIELTITNTPCYPAAITICLHPLCLKRCQKKNFQTNYSIWPDSLVSYHSFATITVRG